MALFETAARIVATYKADTSDVKSKLRELQGEERKLAEQRLKAAEAENRRIEGQIKGLTKWASYIAAGTIAVAAAKRGLDAYAKTSKEAAAEVEKIKTAASTAFEGMEVAIGRVVVALGPLIEKLAEVAKFASKGIGDIALLATDVDGLYKKYGLARDRQTGERYLSEARDNYVRQQVGAGGSGNRYLEAMAGAEFDRTQRVSAKPLLDAVGALNDGIRTMNGFIRGQLNDPWASKPGQKKAGPKGPKADPWEGWSDFNGFGSAGETIGQRLDRGASSFAEFQASFAAEAEKQRLEAANPERFRLAAEEMKNALAEVQAEKRESFLVSAFGPLEEFNAYATAFQTLSGAVGSAMSAWIDGSMSAGKAFKAFIAEAVKGIAVQMAMEALKHGAYAIASLVPGPTFNPAGAAGHAKTAAAFAAGAAVAAGAAKALHGGSGGGAPAPASSYAGGGSGGGAQQGTAVTIVYGDSFADDSPRQRQLKARRMVNTAIGTSAVEYR